MSYLLLESGSKILLEDGASALLLEGSNVVTNYDVITAIQQWFLDQPSLQALFPDGKLTHKAAPEDTLLPYATYFKASDVVDTYTTAGRVRRASIQFNIHAQTDADAQAIADTFGTAIDSIAQQAVIPIVVYGRTAMASLVGEINIDIGEGLGPNGQDCWIAHFVTDVLYTT